MLKFLIVLLAITISSCSPTISNFGSYLPQQFPQTSYMPSPEAVEGKIPKVAVFELDEGVNQTASQADLGKSMTVAIENVLTQNRLAELVDRKIAAKLEKEIALAEMNKTGSYKGPQVAEYAISGSIGNAGFTKKYSAGYIVPNAGGSLSRTSPKFTYSSDVTGNIKIYEIPSMQVVSNLEFSGRKSKTDEVKTNNNVMIGGIFEFGGQKAEGLNRDDALVRNAGREAIDNISYEIKNFFSKKAFILEKRSFKKKTIFKISAGNADGIRMGDKFDVIGKFENLNALTGKSEIERRIISSGVVSDQINPKTAWIIIDDEDTINAIRLGDMVQFKYQRDLWNKTTKLVSNMDMFN